LSIHAINAAAGPTTKTHNGHHVVLVVAVPVRWQRNARPSCFSTPTPVIFLASSHPYHYSAAHPAAHRRATLAHGNKIVLENDPPADCRCMNRSESTLASSRGVTTGSPRSDDAAFRKLRAAHQDMPSARLFTRGRERSGPGSAPAPIRISTVRKGKRRRISPEAHRRKPLDKSLPSRARSILVRERC
jgi:hypothetical protein